MFRKLLSLLSDAAVYGISSLLSQLIGFVLLPLYTRYLVPADQGLITMIVTVTSFFGPLANLGMINAVFRRFNLEKDEAARGRVLGTGLYSVTISSLVLLAILFTFAGSLSRLAVGDRSATALVRLSLITAAAGTIGLVPLAILRAGRRVKITAAVNIFKLLLSVSCTIWLVVFKGLGVWGVLIGTLVGEVATTAGQFAIVFSSLRFAPSWGTWKQMASYGLPFVPHQIQGMTMGILGQYAVGHMLGLEQAGLYSIAVKFTIPIAFIVNSIQNAWVAYKFQVHANDEDPAAFFRTAITYYVAGLMYLWVGVSLWGPDILWLLTAENYHTAAWLIPVCGLVPVSQGIYFMLGTGMELSDDTRPFPLVTLAGLVTAVVSVRTLIPAMGAAGAAIASTNAFIALTIVIYYFSQRRFRIRYDWSTLVPLIVLAVSAVGVGRMSLDLPAVHRLTLAGVISLAFPAVEFAVLLRSSTERHRMRILWSRFSSLGNRFAQY